MRIVIEDVELKSPVRIRPARRMSEDEFHEFCVKNQDMRVERAPGGDILILPLGGCETSARIAELSAELGNWSKDEGRGYAFGFGTEYLLPDGSARSPAASWVLRSRIAALTREQRRKFIPLCPDFVAELMSPSDRITQAKAKMREWIVNGAQLGWLLDPDHRTAYVYRPGREAEKLADPERLIGEGPVAGFMLELGEIWAEL
jgi:Uma2 family endonuclease